MIERVLGEAGLIGYVPPFCSSREEVFSPGRIQITVAVVGLRGGACGKAVEKVSMRGIRPVFKASDQSLMLRSAFVLLLATRPSHGRFVLVRSPRGEG